MELGKTEKDEKLLGAGYCFELEGKVEGDGSFGLGRRQPSPAVEI